MIWQIKAAFALALAVGLSAAMWAFGEHRYHAGEAHVQAAWNAEKVVAQQAAIKAEEQHRATEQHLQSDFHEAQNRYEAQHANDTAFLAAHSDTIDRLQQRLAASSHRGQLSQPAGSGLRTDDETAQLRSDLVGCAERYRQLGSEAAGYSRQVEALQTIVSDVQRELK